MLVHSWESWKAATDDRKCKEAAAEAMQGKLVATRCLQAWKMAPTLSQAADAAAERLFR